MSTASLLFSLQLACPMCLSGASGKSLMAANSAIGLLLVVLLGVLASFFSFILYLARRSRRFSAENETDSNPA